MTPVSACPSLLRPASISCQSRAPSRAVELLDVEFTSTYSHRRSAAIYPFLALELKCEPLDLNASLRCTPHMHGSHAGLLDKCHNSERASAAAANLHRQRRHH